MQAIHLCFSNYNNPYKLKNVAVVKGVNELMNWTGYNDKYKYISPTTI